MPSSQKRDFIKYSVIIPLPQLESIIQTYRFQYNFFAQRGIPSHLTFLFLFDKEAYTKNPELFDKALQKLLKELSQKPLVVDDFHQTPYMFALHIQNEFSEFLHQKQLQFASYFDIDRRNYMEETKRPHITLFTKKGDQKGFQMIPRIKKEVAPSLPVTIYINRIWLLEIHIKENKATLLKEFKK